MVKGFLRIFIDPIIGNIFVNNVYQGSHDLYLEADPGTYKISFGEYKGDK